MALTLPPAIRNRSSVIEEYALNAVRPLDIPQGNPSNTPPNPYAQYNQEVPPEDAYAQLSVTGQGIFGGYDIHEQMDIRDVPLEALDKMLRVDGQAAGLYNILSLPIRAAAKKMSIRGVKNGKREEAFIYKVFTKSHQEGGMYTSFDSTIAHLCMAFLHGFRVFEQVFKLYANEIVLEKLAYVAPYNVYLRANDYGDFNGFAQRQSYQYRYVNVYVNLQKSVLFTINGEKNPLYGVPPLLPAFYHYDKKHKMYYIAHVAHQINSVPIRVGKVPINTNYQKRKNYLDALANLGFNTAIVMPDMHELEQFPKTASKISPYMDIINHHNNMMSKAMLAHFIDLGGGGGSGSWALSKNDYDVFVITLEQHLAAIAEVFNTQIIPQLIDWNFGSKKYPQMYFEPLGTDVKSLLRDVFYKIALDDQPNVSAEFLYESERMMADQLGLNLVYDNAKLNVDFDKENYPRQPIIPPVTTNPAGKGEGNARNKPKKVGVHGATQPKNGSAPNP